MFKTQNISSNSYSNAPIIAAGFPNNTISTPNEKIFRGSIPNNLESILKSEIKTQLTREITYHVVRGGEWQLMHKTIKI
jgi:hypothetical protein